VDDRLDKWLGAFERDHSRFQPLHGDFYPGNVLAVGNRLVGLLDWDEAFVGRPESELAASAWEWGGCLRSGRLTSAIEFVASYGRAHGTSVALDEVAVRQLVRRRLRWEVGVRRNGDAEGPASAADYAYAAAQVAAFHDLAPRI
jgi:aminoglycoside phosphotransferase (APT) family kinase protein